MKNKIELGDLVQLKGIWKNRVGLVDGTSKDFWCIKDHFSAAGAIVHEKDIVIIKKQVVPKKLIKYIK